jgi:hypothetical protein
VIRIMGSCFSCLFFCCGKQDDNSQYGESGDRAQLIDPPGVNSPNSGLQSENYYDPFIDPVFPKKSEEHSDLSKILQEMATNVIDVASLGSHSLEQHEGRDRTNYYVNKMRSLTLSKSLSRIPKQSILLDIPQPERIFASVCVVSAEDLQFMCSILNQIDNLMDNMKIGSYDDLIIPFQVQT